MSGQNNLDGLKDDIIVTEETPGILSASIFDIATLVVALAAFPTTCFRKRNQDL